MPAPIFGKYEVIKRLAVGGMGEVFLARQTGIPGFERHAILKSLLPDVAEQAGAIEEFLDEARVAATLNHPNLVSIYEVGLWEGIYYIAMEYIDGDDLAGLRKAALVCGQFVPFEVTARIVHDAAEGLDHAHKARDMAGKAMEIVHRDISPQNIMVRRDGVTKVVDFGIARAANRSTRTKTGMTKGKLAYMPPEQVRGQKVDGRSDQYALGVVLWELLTGKRLFVGDSDVDLIKQVLRGQIPRPSEIDPSVPAELEAIALQMMSRDAAARFPSCRDVSTALIGWLDRVAPGMSTGEVSQFVVAVFDGWRAKAEKPTKPNENFVIDLHAAANGPRADPTFTRPQNSQIVAAAAAVDGFPASASGETPAIKPRLATSDADEAVAAPVGPTPPPVRASPEVAPAQPPMASSPAAPVAPSPHPPAAGPASKGTSPLLAAAAGMAVLALAIGIARRVSYSKEPTAPPIVSVAPPKPAPAPPPLVVAPPAPLPAKLHLDSTPSGAEVVLADKVLGVTPFDTDQLPPDSPQELEVRLAGYRPEHATVRVSRGMISNVQVELHSIPSKVRATPKKAVEVAATGPTPPAPPVPSFGFLSLDTKPWTQVQIDGQDFGPTPLLSKKLPSGNHKVVMVNDSASINSTRTVTIKADDTTKLILQLP